MWNLIYRYRSTSRRMPKKKNYMIDQLKGKRKGILSLMSKCGDSWPDKPGDPVKVPRSWDHAVPII